MEGFEVIRKDNKVFIRNDLFGDMLVYGIKSHKPYVKRLGSKFYITGDLAIQVYSIWISSEAITHINTIYEGGKNWAEDY